jgi:O-antigen/teichoic acid export membrane protein
MSSQSDAAGDMYRLRKIFVAGNRVCAFTTLPITAVFVILGKSIIEVWVGQRYVAQGYPVLMILTVPYTFLLLQSASTRVLFGMGKHGKFAIVTLIEGVANLVLSIWLVRPYGIIGDALGTAIPLAGTYLLFMPLHLCSRLGVRLWTFVRQAYSLPVALCVPLVLVLLLMRRWFVAHTYPQLALQLAVGAIVYGLGLAWAYWTNRALQVGNLTLSTERLGPEITGIAPALESYREDV